MPSHHRPLLTLLVLLIAACGGSAAVDESSPTPPPASPTVDACVAASRGLGAFTQRMADDLAGLRPSLLASPYVRTPVADAAYRISVTLSAYAKLDLTVAGCSGLAGLQAPIRRQVDAAGEGVNDVLQAQALDAQRGAGLVLLGLLPEVLELARAAQDYSAASGLAIPTPGADATGADVLRWLPPLATPGPIASHPSFTQAEYGTAVLWQQSTFSTYNRTLASLLWELADMHGCGPGSGPQDCVAAKEAGAGLVDRATSFLGAHMGLMDRRPAARCLLDAYEADRRVAAAYQAWLSAWTPAADATEGRAQVRALQQADADARAFLGQVGSFFADCGRLAGS